MTVKSCPIITRLIENKYIDKALSKAAKEIQVKSCSAAKKDGKAYEISSNYDEILKKHMPNAIGLYIAGLQCFNIVKSKDIPKERKAPLAVNAAFIGVFSCTGSYLLYRAIKSVKYNIQKRIDILAKESNDGGKYLKRIQNLDINKSVFENADALKGGLRVIIPSLIAALMFRLIGPVVATPAADKISKFMIKHGLIKDPNEKK